MSTNIQDLPYTPSAPNQELPSRDIPQQTIHHVADPQINPTYVPPPKHDYIGQVHYQVKPKEDWMEEFRIPILLSVLYFLFQMPMVNVFLVRMLPNQISSDGNLTSFGTMVKSAGFGVAYYAILYFLDKVKSS
jgi:hypothetical protein